MPEIVRWNNITCSAWKENLRHPKSRAPAGCELLNDALTFLGPWLFLGSDASIPSHKSQNNKTFILSIVSQILPIFAPRRNMAAVNRPFTVRVLGDINPNQEQHFQSLLPATFRTKGDNIISPQPNIEFLEQELLVKRINRVQDWLWACGRPMPARPLHYQILLGRNITITENMELHLVWSKDRIFIKPIPLYLLDRIL